MAAPAIPTRFPCWVKAVYSWGGEAKGDLGFIEGDLIECLNAGNGSWWTGRLRRDKRMVGLFPSNFVEVLEEDFRPTPPISNVPSLASRQNSLSISNPTTPAKGTSLFRRPFTAYSAASSPNPQASARDIEAKSKEGTPSPPASLSKRWKPKPFSSMKMPQDIPAKPAHSPLRPSSPTIPAPLPRSSSPLPHSRPTSRVPSFIAQQERPRVSSIACQEDDSDSSPPPPPPPAHRVAYTRPYTPEMQAEPDYGDGEKGYLPPQNRSPVPSGRSGCTPSPLRDAMNDVMSSLEDMAVTRDTSDSSLPHTPPNIWSPEAFDEVYQKSQADARPHTSMGLPGRDFDEEDNFHYRTQSEEADAGLDEGPPHLTNYVQRMESRLRDLQKRDSTHEYFLQHSASSPPPEPPEKDTSYTQVNSNASFRQGSAHRSPTIQPFSATTDSTTNDFSNHHPLRTRKSAYELGKERLSRTLTTKSSVTTASSAAQSTSTNATNSTQATSQSLMSGASAGGFSATSAGSLARRNLGRSASIKDRPKSMLEIQRPQTAMGSISYHSSHSSGGVLFPDKASDGSTSSGRGLGLGGLTAPTPKKKGFFKKMLDSAKTSAANARSNIATGPSSRPVTPQKCLLPDGITSISGGPITSSSAVAKDASREMGLTGDWVQVRRDVNRSNSLSRNEKTERVDRCKMSDIPVMRPVEELNQSAEGDEGVDGLPVAEPTDFTACNLGLVDKSTRFLNNLPMTINPVSLAQGYICRPFKSDIQRLRAIFTWVSERVAWEEDFEGDVDIRRVIQTRRGSSEEIALLVMELCAAVGLQAEVVRGYLKNPGEPVTSETFGDAVDHPNHWWNAVIADGEWRIMDCSLASPTNPRRSAFSTVGTQAAESWWFLTRPLEICYTHVPVMPEQQHIVPPQPNEVLLALPVASPAFFKNCIRMWDYDTSQLFLDGLDMAHIQLAVPEGVECVAEVEVHAFARDADGDYFESGDVVNKRVMAQGEFVNFDTPHGPTPPFKRYTIKALLPTSTRENTLSNIGKLKVYAGRRGLMHGLASNPHPLALTLPLVHHGMNPEYEFFARHPTPHALRHELYVTGPLCKRLYVNNTFVFGVRQHRAYSGPSTSQDQDKARSGSPTPNGRPSSAMSMVSATASGSSYSVPSAVDSNSSNSDQSGQQKPAKLAIQSPSGKILRMTRKMEVGTPLGGGAARRNRQQRNSQELQRTGSTWEAIIKIGECGIWRGLVLADRSARWCVFGEWEAI